MLRNNKNLILWGLNHLFLYKLALFRLNWVHSGYMEGDI